MLLKEQQQFLHSILGNRYKLARSKQEYKYYEQFKRGNIPLAHIYMNRAEVLTTQEKSITYICKYFMDYIYHYAKEHDKLPKYMQEDFFKLYKANLGKWDNCCRDELLSYLNDDIIFQLYSYNQLLELRK